MLIRADSNALELLAALDDAPGGTSNRMDDVDFSFLSELLSQGPNIDGVDVVFTSSPSSQSTESRTSAASAESLQEINGSRMSDRKRKLGSSPESAGGNALIDSHERRKILSATSSRRYRSRKKVRASICIPCLLGI
jgi:hypothetical protein